MRANQDKFLDRTRTHGHDNVFIPKDFLDLGSWGVAAKSLWRWIGEKIKVMGVSLTEVLAQIGNPLGLEVNHLLI